MLQRGNTTIPILIALLLGGVACFLGITIYRLESGTKLILESNEAAFRAHSRKLELLELRVLLSRMYAVAVSGAVSRSEEVRTELSELTVAIQRKYGELVSQSSGDRDPQRILSELDPHVQALLSALNQRPTDENIPRWRSAAEDVDLKLREFGNLDDTGFKEKLSRVASAIDRENGAVHTLQTLGFGVVVCALLAIIMYLGAAFRVRPAEGRSPLPAANDLRFASFANEGRRIAKRDPDMRRYRDDFVASFASRLQELDRAVVSNPAVVVEAAQVLADAAATHGFENLSAAAASLHVAARANRTPEELRSLLNGVRKTCDDIQKSIL